MATEAILRRAATDALWMFRIEYFVIKAAVAVMAEDVGTANHANRFAYAKKILLGTENFSRWVVAVLTNSTIAAAADPVSASLSDVEFTVNSMFNAFANSSAV